MFLGTYEPKLLSHNQISLPAKLRFSLSDNRAVLTLGFDKCVYGFSLEDWQKIVDEELLKPLLTEEGRKIRQRVFSKSEIVDFDSQGRFVMPEFMKLYAGISKEMIMIGAGDHFEIWDKTEWEKYSKDMSI
jgi:MraZ protein